MFFVLAGPGLLSQSNLLKNGSFETYYPGYQIPNQLPARISGIYYDSLQWFDEVTRCLGDYQTTNPINPRGYPVQQNRHRTKANGGCDGWYNPIDESVSTPDYFHRDALNWDIGVPDNYFNNYGNNTGSNKQYPYDDNENGIIDSTTTEKAYIGILNVRKLSDTNNTNYNYAEYVTQRIEGGLQAQKAYEFKMRVSWTYGIPSVPNNQTGEYLKGIGAYLSESDPFIYSWVNPLVLDDNTEGLLYDKTYKTINPTYYNEHGGADGTNWLLVENEIQPSKNMNYITLGNFQLNWDIDNRLGGIQDPLNDIVRIYYFIDAVELTEITDFVCSCENTAGSGDGPTAAYHLTVERKLKEPGTDECCYDVFLHNNNFPRICHVNKAKLTIKVNNVTTATSYFEITNSFFHLEQEPIKILENLCITANNGTPIRIEVDLYLNNYIETSFRCQAEFDFVQQCNCDCPDENDSLLNFKISDYRYDLNQETCCYDIVLENYSTCDFRVDFIQYIFDEQDISGIASIAGDDILDYNIVDGKAIYTANTNGMNASANSSITIGTFCVNWESGPISFKIKYGNSNQICDKEWEFTVECEDCCDKIEAVIHPIPVYDDGNQCCFKLDVNIDESMLCKIESIVVTLGSWILFESFTPIQVGETSYIFCTHYMLFGNDQSKPVVIKFFVEDSEQPLLLCEFPAVINKCSNINIPCTPDYPDVDWIKYPLPVQIPFDCPSPPYPPDYHCIVTFNFEYRHVTDQYGSVHRDIQVTDYGFNEDCPCDDEKIKQMLENIWNNNLVINAFGLYEELNWPNNSEKCFYNFRVITSDCWRTFTYQNIDGIYHIRSKCPGMECCYAVYKVCYEKNELGNITLKQNSFERQSQNSGISIQCEAIPSNPPCEGTNCALWAIHGTPTNPKIGISNEDIEENCNVYISTGKGNSENTLNLECQQTGLVEFDIIDLLGILVYSMRFEKSGFNASVQLPDNHLSGVYLIRIRLNNDLIYYNKISIIK